MNNVWGVWWAAIIKLGVFRGSAIIMIGVFCEIAENPVYNDQGVLWIMIGVFCG